MKSKLLLLTLSLLTMLAVPLLAQTSYPAGSEPTVTTDKDDYQPGDIAVFTGTGWTLDTSVTIVLEETPYQGHDEVFFVMVEPDGSWEVKFPIDIKHLGVEFHLLATGGNSGYVAEAFFTDGAYVFNATGLPIGKSITVNLTNAPTSIVTFTTPNLSASYTSSNNTIITFAFEPNPIQSNINYVILNYTNVRIQQGEGQGSGTSTTLQTDNSFNAESNNVSRTITANYGALISNNETAIYGSSVILTSNFYSNYHSSTGIAGKTITFYLDGTAVGTAVTDASGEASLTLDLTSVPTIGKLSVGTYDITTSFAGDTGLLAVPKENSTGSVLTVEQKAASVTPDANTKEYGSSDPALTGTLEGFLAADNVTAVYTRASGET
ncbi:MBG domain-containing protein, partial [Belliella pelovolcani]|uniref:MBG domain-containing protein n=1 Tax=Belliella pelovolcani TaxID=529505 RepID=UPI0039195A00